MAPTGKNPSSLINHSVVQVFYDSKGNRIEEKSVEWALLKCAVDHVRGDDSYNKARRTILKEIAPFGEDPKGHGCQSVCGSYWVEGYERHDYPRIVNNPVTGKPDACMVKRRLKSITQSEIDNPGVSVQSSEDVPDDRSITNRKGKMSWFLKKKIVNYWTGEYVRYFTLEMKDDENIPLGITRGEIVEDGRRLFLFGFASLDGRVIRRRLQRIYFLDEIMENDPDNFLQPCKEVSHHWHNAIDLAIANLLYELGPYNWRRNNCSGPTHGKNDDGKWVIVEPCHCGQDHALGSDGAETCWCPGAYSRGTRDGDFRLIPFRTFDDFRTKSPPGLFHAVSSKWDNPGEGTDITSYPLLPPDVGICDDDSTEATEVSRDSGAPKSKEATEVSCDDITPKLTLAGYVVSPTLEEMKSMTENDLSAVSGFTAARGSVGSVRWDDSVDVRGIDLDDIISIEHGLVTVYAEQAKQGTVPKIGEALNRPAVVTMLNVFPDAGRDAKEFQRELEKHATHCGADLISCDSKSGVWKFRVHLLRPESITPLPLCETISEADREAARIAISDAVVNPNVPVVYKCGAEEISSGSLATLSDSVCVSDVMVNMYVDAINSRNAGMICDGTENARCVVIKARFLTALVGKSETIRATEFASEQKPLVMGVEADEVLFLGRDVQKRAYRHPRKWGEELFGATYSSKEYPTVFDLMKNHALDSLAFQVNITKHHWFFIWVDLFKTEITVYDSARVNDTVVDALPDKRNILDEIATLKLEEIDADALRELCNEFGLSTTGREG